MFSVLLLQFRSAITLGRARQRKPIPLCDPGTRRYKAEGLQFCRNQYIAMLSFVQSLLVYRPLLKRN